MQNCCEALGMSQTSTDPRRSRDLVAAWTRVYGAGHPPLLLQGAVAPRDTASRSEADALAAWRRWHDPGQDTRFSTREWSWYALFERARVETLARRHLAGMSSNLTSPAATSPGDSAMATLYHAARDVFAGHGVTTPILEPPRSAPAPTSPWLTRLFRPWHAPSALSESSESAAESPFHDGDVMTALRTASTYLEAPGNFAESLAPLVQRLTAYYAQTADDQLTLHGDDANASPEESAEEDAEGVPLARQDMADELAERDDRKHDYAVYSRRWDEQQAASYWYRSEDAAALKSLDILDRRRVRQLAHRLQRRLMAARLRHWSFDQDEGRLDSRRLARLIGDNPSQRIFRVENDAPVPEACVTLLVDQSGSMRGQRRRMAAIAIDLAVHTLEMCQIRCEVLGFTTRFNANNPLARHWRQHGSPSMPGRLNAIRHIIYKTPEQPWRRARPHLGLLLRDELGHENIDGEALYWAAKRLIRQPQPRKVLVVLSDGAPYDKATAHANGRGFLEQHLRRVIHEIDQSPITLAALGTGQEVARFYRQALTVRRPEAVAECLFERLGDLLTQSQPTESRP